VRSGEERDIAHNEEVRHRGATAVVTIAAGVMSLASLVVGLSGADFDFEAVSESASFIALGTDAVAPVRWGLWLSMFGSYLLLVPVALLLLGWLRQDDPVVGDLAAVAAGFYILLGAAGASVLASTLPDLIQRYADADAAMRAGLLNDFDLARRIAEDGLQGVVQNVAGAAWFLGMGSLLVRHRPALGAAAVAVGVFLVVNAVGIMVDVEALRFIGLTGNVLLAPAWAIGMGTSLLRAGDHRVTA
jgi:hypothetical protein